MPQQLEQCLDVDGKKWRGYFRDPVSGVIYFQKQVEKKRARFSTGIKSPSHCITEIELKKIERIALAELAAIMRGEKIKSKAEPVIADEIERIKDDYQKRAKSGDIAHHTLNTVNSSYAKLLPFWSRGFPKTITKEKWTEYQDWFEKQYPGENQFNVTKYMKVLVSHCIERGLLLHRPKIRDRHAKKQREARKRAKARVYIDQEILALDKACESDFERLAIRLGYMMGFRISDVVNLSWERIHLKRKTPFISFTEGDDKADYEGRTPIPDDISEILARLTRESKWVFPQKLNLDQHIRPQQFDFIKIKELAKVKWGTFHSLRHYRLSKDFKDPRYTSMQVCLIRRVSLDTAKEHYVHTEESDLELMRNAGSLVNLGRGQ